MATESLTTGQKQALARWREEWSQIERDTAPADRPGAEAAISDLYRAVGEGPPLFIWVDSPLAGLLTLGFLRTGGYRAWSRELGDPSAVERQDRVEQGFTSRSWPPHQADFVGGLWQQLGRTGWSELHRALGETLAGQEGCEQLWWEACDWLRGNAWLRIWDRLSEQLLGQFPNDRLASLLHSPGTPEKAWNGWHAQVHAIQRDLEINQEHSSDDLWLGRARLGPATITEYEFCSQVLGVTASDADVRRLERFGAVARACAGWWWPLRRFCVVSERPLEVHVDHAGTIHHSSAAAVAFRDGFAAHVWHGTRVPENWITDPGTLDPAWAIDPSGRNSEQRRIIAEIIGWSRIVEQFRLRVVDKDDDPTIGELLEVELPPDPNWGVDAQGWIPSNFDELPPPVPRFARFLKVRCGTGREFVLSVPREMRTAREANAWTYALRPDELELEART
jgi:hypothetical protein